MHMCLWHTVTTTCKVHMIRHWTLIQICAFCIVFSFEITKLNDYTFDFLPSCAILLYSASDIRYSDSLDAYAFKHHVCMSHVCVACFVIHVTWALYTLVILPLWFRHPPSLCNKVVKGTTVLIYCNTLRTYVVVPSLLYIYSKEDNSLNF